MQWLIRMHTAKGGIVLDPFLGSGTTCTVARALNRRSIGIEYSPAYAASAFERIKKGPVRSCKRPDSNSFVLSRRRSSKSLTQMTI